MNRKELIQQSEDCISRQALIKRIDYAEENFKVDNMDSISTGEENPFVDGVLSGVFNIRKMIAQAPSVAPTTKWIPVSERLPEPQKNGNKDYSDWLQVTIKIGHPIPTDAYVAEGYYCFSEEKWYTKRFVVGEVTAWQPLPTPYKAESEVK